jgi:hypothetical protein
MLGWDAGVMLATLVLLLVVGKELKGMGTC